MKAIPAGNLVDDFLTKMTSDHVTVVVHTNNEKLKYHHHNLSRYLLNRVKVCLPNLEVGCARFNRPLGTFVHTMLLIPGDRFYLLPVKAAAVDRRWVCGILSA